MSHCCKCNKLMDIDNQWYGLHKECFMKWFDLSDLSEFSDIIPRSQSLGPLKNHEKNDSFFHGAFRKYSSRLGENNYILKVVHEEHPELQATEFLCNQIYELLGIEIPRYYLMRYPEDRFCFVTKNFMSHQSNSSLIHIWLYLLGKEEHTCEKLVSIIGEKTGRRTEQERFVYLTLADCLIGNHDRHGRNLGFIQSPKGIQLAPFYDNPSFIGLDNDWMLGADLQPRGAIFTKASKEPTMKDYIIEWNRLGYGYVVDQFRKSYSFKKISEKIQESFLSKKRQNALLRIIEKRGKELCAL